MKTAINVIVSVALAICAGLIFADSIRYMFGTDTSTLYTTQFNDRMNSVKAVFTEDNWDYQVMAQGLCESSNIQVLRSRSGNAVVYDNGRHIPAGEYFDNTELLSALSKLLAGTEAMKNQVGSDSDPIEDIALYNIAVTQQQVMFFLYYDSGGYISIVYDESGTYEARSDTIKIMDNWMIQSEMAA